MDRDEYIRHSLDYFNGKISIEQLMRNLDRKISFLIEGDEMLPKERFLLISNHALHTPELYIPSKEIENIKGGNKYGYDTYHFPIILQSLFNKLIKNKFTAVVGDVGWNDVAQEFGHLVVNHKKGDGVKCIVSRLVNSQKPIIIFPEGGARNFSEFHSGFLHIALMLKIRYLVVVIISPKPSLRGCNFLKVIDIINLETVTEVSEKFVNEQRTKMIDALKRVR